MLVCPVALLYRVTIEKGGNPKPTGSTSQVRAALRIRKRAALAIAFWQHGDAFPSNL